MPHRCPAIRRRAVASALVTALLASCGTAVGTLTGCSNQPPRVSYSAPLTPEDEVFLRGTDRPANAGTLFAMARMLISQGRLGEAEMMLRRSIEIEPGFVPSYNELAELGLRRQRVGDAAELLAAALEIAPDHGRLLNNLGMCWLLRDEHDLALDYFTRAAVAMPEDARPRANMATALGMMGRYDEALAIFTQIMPLAEAHYNVAILSEARSDTARAEIEFRTASELDNRLARAAGGDGDKGPDKSDMPR